MDTEKYKTKLLEEKKQLEEILGELGVVDKTGDWEATPDNETANQEVPDEADMAERSADYHERSIKLDSLEERLEDIRKALDKIESGDYGICEVCGKEIEADRLEANPSAMTCKNCMNKD